MNLCPTAPLHRLLHAASGFRGRIATILFLGTFRTGCGLLFVGCSRRLIDLAASDTSAPLLAPALGLAAALGEAGSLLKAGKNAEALTLLQGLEARLPGENRSVQLRQMLAEAAARAGQKDLAAKTYQALAQEVNGLDGEYFRVRAEALVPAAGRAPEKPVQN